MSALPFRSDTGTLSATADEAAALFDWVQTVDRVKLVDLLARHWAPGDVYYACALAQLIGRPCRYVVEVWERDHGILVQRAADTLMSSRYMPVT